MDLAYLLWLQDFRNSINNAWTPFMEFVSDFAVFWFIMIPVFYYWNTDKKNGLITLLAYYVSIVINPLIKLTACVYRPWIRESRIIPAGDSITTATGYSFPSGHTTTASSLSGGMAYCMWQNKRTRWLSAVFAFYVLLTGFSRNYLGVHTPQDVVIGLLTGIFSIFAAVKIVNYVSEHPEKENMLLLIGFAICCAALAYITLKPYPSGLNEAGELVVDPQKMMNDGYGDIGRMMGFLIARYVEKTWIRFKPAGLNPKGIIICLIGLVPMVLMSNYLQPVLIGAMGSHWGKLLYSAIYVFYYIALFPIVLKVINREKTEDAEVI